MEEVINVYLPDEEYNKNQASEMIKKYKSSCQDKVNYKSNVSLFNRINLMTPENIHLNSFMYEPIIDMGATKLNDIYKEISEQL
jgi:hypothetical protein